MINIDTLKTTYVAFATIDELEDILDVFKRFGFGYKNGTLDDALDLAEGSVVDKIICHDNFVMTSKEKVTTISYKVFMKLSNQLTSNTILANNNKKETMNTNTCNSPRAIINGLKAERLYKDESYVEALAVKAEGIETVVSNFLATLDKAEEKANKVSELLVAYTNAISDRDIAGIEKLEKLIDSSMKYVTKTNKVLAAINDTGEAIIKADKKEDKVSGKEFIGE